MQNNNKLDLRPGFLSIILHAHLPFVRHPEYSDMMEERWLYEAITETYIPLIDVFYKLINEGIDFRITMTLTPPLLNMLSDELLMDRYSDYLAKLEELSEKEVTRTKDMPEFYNTARLYRDKYRKFRDIFEKLEHNLISAFKYFQEKGVLEIITCCATHGFLPLMKDYRPSVRAQIEVGVSEYVRFFNRQPRGIWLAECAFHRGDDKILNDFGIEYFITDSHGITKAEPRPTYGVYAPIKCPSGVKAFGRDMESGHQVWSSIIGYPGDPYYREFYRDIGYDLDFDYIKPYIHESGMRLNTGIKYYRITDRNSSQKEPYSYQEAMKRAASHGAHFIWCRERQVEYLMKHMDRKPIVVAPYDCELFGHWWYEGPDFIYYVLKKTSLESKYVSLVTPSDYIDYYPGIQEATPSDSTWGANGYSEVWLNETNAYIYPHMHKAAERMIKLADTFPDAEGLTKDALNQAARELMLLQSSDWAFIMKMDTTVGYAKKRVKDHVFRFTKLYEDINKGQINESWLREVEKRDNIFPEMDYRVYRSSRNDK
ncbi:MAG: DUF1957 domain-containing protein [Candidatus Riflebacteria bacterium]|nr:DUF1957 domain-containing protein [Candidatus Riflebacteria bacterium]